jgi:hypothetical protein
LGLLKVMEAESSEHLELMSSLLMTGRAVAPVQENLLVVGGESALIGTTTGRAVALVTQESFLAVGGGSTIGGMEEAGVDDDTSTEDESFGEGDDSGSVPRRSPRRGNQSVGRGGTKGVETMLLQQDRKRKHRSSVCLLQNSRSKGTPQVAKQVAANPAAGREGKAKSVVGVVGSGQKPKKAGLLSPIPRLRRVEEGNSRSERVLVLGRETIAARAAHEGDMAAKLRARRTIEWLQSLCPGRGCRDRRNCNGECEGGSNSCYKCGWAGACPINSETMKRMSGKRMCYTCYDSYARSRSDDGDKGASHTGKNCLLKKRLRLLFQMMYQLEAGSKAGVQGSPSGFAEYVRTVHGSEESFTSFLIRAGKKYGG